MSRILSNEINREQNHFYQIDFVPLDIDKTKITHIRKISKGYTIFLCINIEIGYCIGVYMVNIYVCVYICIPYKGNAAPLVLKE